MIKEETSEERTGACPYSTVTVWLHGSIYCMDIISPYTCPDKTRQKVKARKNKAFLYFPPPNDQI